MKYTFQPSQKGAVRVRLALAGALVAGSVALVPHAGLVSNSHAATPKALQSSVKPDWRGADYGNSGVLTTTGPTLSPALIGTIAPSRSQRPQRHRTRPSGNVIFNNTSGAVYSYTAAGAQNSAGHRHWCDRHRYQRYRQRFLAAGAEHRRLRLHHR